MFSSSSGSEAADRIRASGPDLAEAEDRCVSKPTPHYRELSPKSARAARWMLYEPGSCSMRLAGRLFGKDYSWLSRALRVSASLSMEVVLEMWSSLLADLRQLQDKEAIECLRFSWCLMADETPSKARVHLSTPDGEKETDSIMAKVMAARACFSMLIRVKSQRADEDTSGEADPAGDEDTSGEADPAGDLYILHGCLPTTLRPLQSQKAGVVRAFLHEHRVPEQETLEGLFRDLHWLPSTDLHPSMLAATGAESRAMPKWRSMHLRCGIHRTRTAELNALHQDPLTDSFFMNMTLSLRGAGTMAELRRSAKVWIQPRRRIVRGHPPQEVLAWRECVVSCLRSRVGQGLDTKFQAVLLHAWDTVYTGDGRKQDVVEHYHTPTCSGNDEECLQQCSDSIDHVLSHIPTLYSRRSWHGQIRTTSHIIVLEAIGGILSQNYGGIQAKIEKKAQARRKTAAAEQGRAGCSSTGASGAPVPAGAKESAGNLLEASINAQSGTGPPTSNTKACQLAAEEEARCRSVREFWNRPDHFARMLRFQFFVQAFAEARSPALIRAGPQWEAEQWAGLLAGQGRSYRVTSAHIAADIIHGQKLVSQLGSGAYGPAANWYTDVSPLQTFAMAARGGASMHDLGYVEQQRYDYKLFAILEDPERQAPVVAKDAVKRSHILGEVAQGHTATYPDAKALQLQESLAAVECDATIAPDSTQTVEQGHASVKRGKTIREETYKEEVEISSAWRTLDLERNALSTSLAAQIRSVGSDAPELAAANLQIRSVGRHGPELAAANPPQRRTRKHSLWQAWCSLYGGWVTRAKRLQYLEDMEDPEIRERCRQQAVRLTTCRTWGGRHRRSEDRRIRRERLKCKRSKKTWDRSAALASIRRQDMSAFHVGKKHALSGWSDTRKRKRDIAATKLEALRQFAQSTPLPSCLSRFSDTLVPHPAQYAKSAFVWLPDHRPEVERRLGHAMRSESSDRLVAWELKHDVLLNTSAMKISSAPAAAQRRSQCCKQMWCGCQDDTLPLRAFLDSMRRTINTALRTASVTVLAMKGENELRKAADTTLMVIGLHSPDGKVASWLHVSHVRYQPLRPVFLRLCAETARTLTMDQASLERVVLRLVEYQEENDSKRWWWVLDHDAFLTLDLAQTWHLQFYRVVDVTRTHGELRLHAEKFRGATRVVWRGVHNEAPALERMRLKAHQDDEAEQAQRDDGDADADEKDPDDDDEDDNDDNGDREDDLQKRNGAPEPVAALQSRNGAPEPVAASSLQPAKPKSRKIRLGSDTPWVRPLIPGHHSSKFLVPDQITECMLNRITRSAQNTTSWVARYHGEAPVLWKREWPPGARLNQKTRSVTYDDGPSEHDAFRETLLWLWRRHLIHVPAEARAELPEHVSRALAPRDQGDLAPCPACVSRTCTFMEDAPKLFLKYAEVSEEMRRSGSHSGALELAVVEPASCIRSGSRSGAPEPAVQPLSCILCRGPFANKHAEVRVCGSCVAMDAAAHGLKANVPSWVRRPPSGSAFELRPDDGQPLLGHRGADWERVQVPGNGDCLFCSMALSKMLLEGLAVPPFDKRARLGVACRKLFLESVASKVSDGGDYLEAAPLSVLIQSSTDLRPEEYLRRMRSPNSGDRRTWGGFLEIAILCKRWACSACIFRTQANRISLLACVGNEPRAGFAHKGICALVWWGAHYEALRLSDVALTRLVEALAPAPAQ